MLGLGARQREKLRWNKRAYVQFSQGDLEEYPRMRAVFP